MSARVRNPVGRRLPRVGAFRSGGASKTYRTYALRASGNYTKILPGLDDQNIRASSPGKAAKAAYKKFKATPNADIDVYTEIAVQDNNSIHLYVFREDGQTPAFEHVLSAKLKNNRWSSKAPESLGNMWLY